MDVELTIISGLSGAGKATAARVFEDLSFSVIDNLPPHLLSGLVNEYRTGSGSIKTAKLAVVIDSRSGPLLADFPASFDGLAKLKPEPHLLFLEASDAVLVKRFKETRRPHPLFHSRGGILAGIEAERTVLRPVRERANNIIDTSTMNALDLRAAINRAYGEPDKSRRLTVTVEAFGFKYGIPLDADLVFDVRFLRNPYYIDDLRPFDGRDKVIDDYVMSDPFSEPLVEKLCGLIEFTLPRYVEEGKACLTIAIGCTGGQHRSIVIAERLAAFLRGKGYVADTHHRDLGKA